MNSSVISVTSELYSGDFMNTCRLAASNVSNGNQLKRSRIENLPNSKRKVDLASQPKFVVVFQAIEIERLSLQVEALRSNLTDAERRLFAAKNHQVQISELNKKCFDMEALFEKKEEAYQEEIEYLKKMWKRDAQEREREWTRQRALSEQQLKTEANAIKQEQKDSLVALENKYKNALDTNSKELQRTSRQLENVTGDLNNVMKQYDNDMKTLSSKHQDEVSSLSKQLTSLYNLHQSHAQLEQLRQGKISELESILSQLSRCHEREAAFNKQLASDSDAKTAQIKELWRKLGAMEDQTDELREKNHQVLVDSDAKTIELRKLEQQNIIFENQAKAIEAQNVAKIRSLNQNFAKQMSQLRSDLKKNSTVMDALSTRFENCRTKILMPLVQKCKELAQIAKTVDIEQTKMNKSMDDVVQVLNKQTVIVAKLASQLNEADKNFNIMEDAFFKQRNELIEVKTIFTSQKLDLSNKEHLLKQANTEIDSQAKKVATLQDETSKLTNLTRQQEKKVQELEQRNAELQSQVGPSKECIQIIAHQQKSIKAIIGCMAKQNNRFIMLKESVKALAVKIPHFTQKDELVAHLIKMNQVALSRIAELLGAIAEIDGPVSQNLNRSSSQCKSTLSTEYQTSMPLSPRDFILSDACVDSHLANSREISAKGSYMPDSTLTERPRMSSTSPQDGLSSPRQFKPSMRLENVKNVSPVFTSPDAKRYSFNENDNNNDFNRMTSPQGFSMNRNMVSTANNKLNSSRSGYPSMTASTMMTSNNRCDIPNLPFSMTSRNVSNINSGAKTERPPIRSPREFGWA